MGSTFFPNTRTTLVGVLNLTPDSFSDGGRFLGQVNCSRDTLDIEGALVAAKDLVAGGAAILDVGGESTRPGAREVPEALEIERTAPLIERLVRSVDVPVSIDTRKARVAHEALRAGARIVNDVSGLGHQAELADVVAEHRATLIVGHMRGSPATMQDAPGYRDVLEEVTVELRRSLWIARKAGISNERLVVDPGIGFGKRLEDNLVLITGVQQLRQRLGLPVMLGPSRKSFLGTLTGEPVDQRDQATAAVCAVAAFLGADALRVHDPVAAHRAVTIGTALRAAPQATRAGLDR